MGLEWKLEKCEFTTKKEDIFRMADWCYQYSPDFIIMESTGVYWVSPLNCLERSGLKAYIVNPSSVKGMAGKKTDQNDAEWLAIKGNEGSFKPSYIPTYEWRMLRDLSRSITSLTQEVTRLKNRELKMYIQMGYRLDTVFSDPFGVNAQRAKDAILAGKSPSQILASIETKRLKASKEELYEAFNGDLDAPRVLVINSLTESRRQTEEKIATMRKYLQDKVEELEPELFSFLQTIPGVDRCHATTLIVELGGSGFIEAFKDAKRFAAWLGVCPRNKESGGKIYNNQIGHGNRALRSCLCEIAHAASHANGTSLQSFYRALRGKSGTKKTSSHLLIASQG